MQSQKHPSLSFLNSRSYYIVLMVGFAMANIDFALTIYGLSNGGIETRTFFWLHGFALAVMTTLIYAVMYRHSKKVATGAALVLTIVLPMLPIISNVMMLLTGESPFV